MQLRQANISKIDDVKWATLEPNGRMGYILQEKAQAATKEDIQKIMDMINERLPYIRLATEQNQLTMDQNTDPKRYAKQEYFYRGCQ